MANNYAKLTNGIFFVHQ